MLEQRADVVKPGVCAGQITAISSARLESAADLAGEVRIGRVRFCCGGLWCGERHDGRWSGYVVVAVVAVAALPVHNGHQALAEALPAERPGDQRSSRRCRRTGWRRGPRAACVDGVGDVDARVAAAEFGGARALPPGLLAGDQPTPVPSGLRRLIRPRSTPFVLVRGSAASSRRVSQPWGASASIVRLSLVTGRCSPSGVARLSICGVRSSRARARIAPAGPAVDSPVQGGREFPLPASLRCINIVQRLVGGRDRRRAPARYVGPRLRWRSRIASVRRSPAVQNEDLAAAPSDRLAADAALRAAAHNAGAARSPRAVPRHWPWTMTSSEPPRC